MDRAESPLVRGWLLLLCALLLLWGPLQIAFVASTALQALSLRGLPLALVLGARVVVAAFGIAAGIALFTRQALGVPMARASLVLSAATDVFVYTTPYFPNNRMPGDTAFYVAGSLGYYGAWLLYLWRSKRVERTC